MNTLLYILLIIIVFGFLLELLLDILNLRSMSSVLPEQIADVYPADKYRLQQEYKFETTQFSIIQSILSLVVTVFVLYSGWLGLLHQYIVGYGYGNIINTLLFFAAIGFVAKVLSLPFALWGTFVIETKYGFNKTTPWLFFTDSIKSLLLAVTIGGGLLALITWIFYATGEWFWLLALGVMLLFSLIANALYSRVIVPLFNKQEPLQEGELLDSIKQFAQKAGFPVNKVFVIDGSKRSTKANAYFTGFGRNRRVVLYDTLIEKMTTDEIVAVLAHEVGHYKKRHIWINFGLGALQSAIVLYIFGRMSQSLTLTQALGFADAIEPVFHLSIIAFGILFSPIELFIGMFTNVLSRAMEYQADAFAKNQGLAKSLVAGLKKLSAQNFSNLTPHPWYVFVNYSHPTLYQRIIKLVDLE